MERKQVRRDPKASLTDVTELSESVAVAVFLSYWLFFYKTCRVTQHAADRLKQYNPRSRDAPPMSKQSSAGQVGENKRQRQ